MAARSGVDNGSTNEGAAVSEPPAEREFPQQAVYEEWGRDDVRPFIPRSARSVLEVGCGRGGFGKTLRQTLGPHA